MAQGCEALPLTEDCLPAGMELLSLPGHSWNMVGFRTAEDIVYLADCLFGRETLEKYQISFLVDVQGYLDTLERIQQLNARLFVPSHAEPAEDIRELAQFNSQKVRETADGSLI